MERIFDGYQGVSNGFQLTRWEYQRVIESQKEGLEIWKDELSSRKTVILRVARGSVGEISQIASAILHHTDRGKVL